MYVYRKTKRHRPELKKSKLKPLAISSTIQSRISTIKDLINSPTKATNVNNDNKCNLHSLP